MAFFGLYKSKTEKMLEDIRLAIQTKPRTTPGEFSRKVKESRRTGRRDLALGKLTQEQARATRKGPSAEIECVYDLNEVIRLQDIEPYFRVSVDRHVEMIMKNGFRLKGKNPETVDYIEDRIAEIETISDQPFGDMLRELVRNCVSVHNGYWVFSRDQTRSTGRRIKMWGKTLDPISAISIPDPATVRVKQTATGRPYQWVQRVPGYKKTKTWAHHDVIHVPLGRKSGFVHGTPYVIPALEDIRALRKLEMIAEHVAHKFAFPFMHWKVGTDEWPAGVQVDPQTNEPVADIDSANNYAENMAQEGFVVTSHRHEIAIIGVEGQVVDLDPFIKHYEARVLSALRLSEVDLGRGDTSNRGTAQVMNQVLVDSCQEYQDTISQYVTMKFLNILLMEGGYPLNSENKVMLSWPPIDREEARAQEAHGLNLYVQGAITRPEARIEYLERDELTEQEEEGLFIYKHMAPLIEMETQSKIRITKAKPATPGAGGGGGAGGSSAASKSKSASKRSSSTSQPSNQFGRLAARPRVPKNDIFNIWYAAAENIIAESHKESEETGLAKDKRPKVTKVLQDVLKTLRGPLGDEWLDGVNEVFAELKANGHESNGTLPRVKDTSRLAEFITQFHRRDLNRIGTTLMICTGISPKDGLFDTGRSVTTVMPGFDTTLVALSRRIDRSFRGARLLGQLDAFTAVGLDEVDLVNEDGGVVESVRLRDKKEVLGIASNPSLVDLQVRPSESGE